MIRTNRQQLLDGSELLRFPHKKIRAQVIADFVAAAGYRGVVVFSCGNAAKALRDTGLDVIEAGPRGDIKPSKWWSPAEIHREWPDRFDATSGHLPIPLMVEIAKSFRAYLGELAAQKYTVPTGSGETAVCLKIAYPLIDFRPLDDSSKPETTCDPQAPLNLVLDALSTSLKEPAPWPTPTKH